MTSSSSLYGSTSTQNSSSTNSTSLYGDAGTPIPDSSGNVIVRGTLTVNGCAILTNCSSFSFLPLNATSIGIGASATSISIGASGGITTINNQLATANYTFPVADGSAGQVLVTDGSGTVSFAAASTVGKTYSIDASSTTGGANFNLVSSDPSIDTIKFANGGHITATGTSASIITLGSDATDANTASTIVARDASGNFSAGTITADLTGNASGTAANVTGTVATANGGTGQITYTDGQLLIGNSTGNTLTKSTLTAGTGITITNGSGAITIAATGVTGVSSVTGSGFITASPTTGAVTIGSNATSTNTASTIVARDASGNFSAGTITAALSGNATTATTATTATQVSNSLTAGTHLSGGPFNGSSAVTLTTDATDANTASTIVARDASGRFSADGATLGNVVIGGVDDNLITTLAGDLKLDSFTGNVYVDNATFTTGSGNAFLFNGVGTTTVNAFEGATSITMGATTGTTTIRNNLITSGDLTVNDAVVFNGSTSGSVTIAAPAVAGSQSYTLPTAVPAVSGYVLSSTTGGTMSWVANPDVNTTYDFNATSTTGGANLNLVGSDATTDTVKLSNGTGVGIGYVSGTEVSISIGQDVATTATPSFTGLTIIPPQPNLGGSSTFNQPTGTSSNLSYNLPSSAGAASTVLTNDGSGNLTWALPGGGGSTFGNVTVGVDTDQTISTTSGNLVLQTAGGVNSGTITVAAGTNGNITLAPNGTGHVILSDDSYVLGQLVATRNTAYVAPASALTTIAGSNGIVVSSSSGGAGYSATIAVRYHSGDTTSTTNSAASVTLSGASGTNSAPGGAAANQVMGTTTFDGYTAGTSNNYAGTIATTNQGAGTTAISPLQAQGYARQAFTNSTTVTTAVTGASGTGSVATLTFTTQNTAPYAVGQTVTIAGMTPSGYNGTVVITVSTTSSISYANATTGFTSGGTIAATNTVTAAGMGFRVRGFANSTNMTAGNRFNFMDLTASAANFKSNTYTFANEVITGSTLAATNYLTLTSTGATITGAGLSQITRTTVGVPTVVESRPSMNIQLIRSDQAGPTSGDGTGFRSRTGGSNGTIYTISDLSSNYSSTGDTSWALGLANGDQTGATFTSVQTITSKVSETKIRAGTPSATPGASTVSDVAIFTPANTTVKSDAVTLQTNAGVALVGSAVSYNRVYGQFQYDTTVTPVAADTAYVFPLGTADVNNIATVGSTSRLIAGAAGIYNLQFSIQVENADNSNDHDAYIWLRKNGSDVTGSMGRTTVPKNNAGSLKIIAWNYIVSSANTTDYWEIAYAVSDTDVTFPAFAATAFGPSTATIITSLVPVGV